MSQLKFVKPERIYLKDSPDYSEKWVQDHIAEDPSILNLGDLILKDRERMQSGAGRLDMLFQDAEENIRYEVEIQLGKTNESHIIRTIEYWDLEKKRFPNYDHVAVIIAEEITNRFMNVIHLFNGVMPLLAIKMEAIKLGDQIYINFIKVLDQRDLSLFEDEVIPELTDRSYWEKRGTKSTVELADQLLGIVNSFDPKLSLKYNKFYIGLAQNNQPFNFAVFRPQKAGIKVEIKFPRSEEIDTRLENMGLEILSYSTRNSMYKIRLTKELISKKGDLLRELFLQSYKEFGGENIE